MRFKFRKYYHFGRFCERFRLCNSVCICVKTVFNFTVFLKSRWRFKKALQLQADAKIVLQYDCCCGAAANFAMCGLT